MEVDPSNVDAEDPSASATLRYQAKKSEREDVQKRTFTKWINMRLVRAKRSPITDLFEDMKDGTVLMSLIEVLTGQNLNPEKGNTRVHHLNNVNHSIKFLEKQYNIKLVNICSDDVVNGNTKLILGLIWNLVLHWQIKDVMKVPGGDRPQSNLEKTLLSWCKECTQGYQRVNITNFTTSFRDGLAFNALFHHFRPDDFSFESLLRKDNLSNLKHAFIFAEKTFGIEQILEPEDVNVEQPDKKSVLIYVMCCYQTLDRLQPQSLHGYRQQFSPDSGSFAVTSPSSPPPFYDQISSPEEVPWMLREAPWSPREKDSLPTSSSAATDISGATNEVEKYQGALEGALVWLLQAKSGLAEKPEVSDEVKVVKKQFQEHEEFMIQLTEKQSEVGELFDWGNEMMRSSRLGEWTEKEIEAQMKLLNEQWEELRVHAMDRQTRLQRALTQLQQKQLDDLGSWLERMEGKMEKSADVLHRGSLQERIDAHKALQEEVESQQQQVSSLQNMVVVVDDNNSDDAYEALEKQLESLGRRWATVCRWVEDSCADLKEGVTLWAEYERRREEFSAWLDSCESRLNDQKVARKVERDSQFKDVMDQVRELKSLELEMDRWMPRFDELSTTGGSLEGYITDHEESIERINGAMQSLKDRWDAIVKVMESKSKEIEDSGVELRDSGDGTIVASRMMEGGSTEVEAIEASELEEHSLNKRIKMDEGREGSVPSVVVATAEENVRWLKEKVDDLATEAAKSSTELSRRRDSCKNLLEQLSQRESALFALEKDPNVRSEGWMEGRRKELDVEWKELKRKVEDKLEQLSNAQRVVGHYNSVMKEEMRWQEQMTKILSRKPRPSGDAEELAEELDLLENLTSSRNSANVDHLLELSPHLSSLSHHFQPSSVLASPPDDLEAFAARNATLVAQAKERMKNLEEGINAAQSREGRIIDMTQWMSEVSATLQHHLEADLLAGDVPDEHNSLVQEFAEHEEFLSSLDGDVEAFEGEGKHEAAERLKQQIQLLKKQFEEVKQKLLRFQKPPDFDSKMSLVRRVLEEINDSIQLLEVGGNKADEIQSQLEQYQKFYKKMSELKPDVEYVVRTGRQVVDRKQVEFPNRLNSQIDAIKMHYNKLGSQVTTGKVSLEKCLRLSRKITKELENIRNLVAKVEERFASTSESRGLDRRTEEVVAIDSFLTEANNKKGIVPTLKDAVAQWARICMEGSMREPSVDVGEVEEKLLAAIQLLTDRRNQLSAPRGGVENVPPTNQRLTDFLVSPSLLTSVDRFLDKIKSVEVTDVEELKKLVREEDNFENEINLELRRLAKVKDDRKGQGDLEVAEQISNVVNNLQSRWMVCKSELKAKLQQQQQQQQVDDNVDESNTSSCELVDSLNSDVDNISCWLDEVEAKVGSDGAKTKDMDEVQLQALKDQARERKAELEAIVRKIRSSKNPRLLSETSPILMRINRRLQKIQSSLLSSSHLLPPRSEPSSLEQPEDRRTPTTELRVQTPLERQIFFDSNGKPVSTARNEIRRQTRPDEVDRREEVFEAKDDSAPLYSRVVKMPSNQREDRVAKGVAEDLSVGHKAGVHHKEWNIAMPDEMVQVEHHHHHHHPQQQQQQQQQQMGPKTTVQVVSGPQNKERFITGLNNFMSVIMEKAKPHSILIGSMNEIDEAVQKEKTKLQELQAMMPSIKTLVGKLELMQHDPDWSQNTKALTKRLCENWDKAMQDIKDRQMELVEMKDDGLKFEEEVEELERKMSLFRGSNNNNNSNNSLNRNNSQLTDLRNKMESVDDLCLQLTNKYHKDDPKKIRSLVNKARNRWHQLSGQEPSPPDAEWKFNVDSKDLQLWLTRVELILGNLSEKEVKTSGVSERNQLKTAAEDLKREIVERKSFIRSLSSTASQIINQAQDPKVPPQIQCQISDSSSRWKRVKDELDDLILKLSEHHQQQQRQQQGSFSFDSSSRDSTLRKNNQKLHEQLLATRSIEDALINQPPVSDELNNLRAQKATFQSLLDRINEQRPYVLSTLEREKNSTDDKTKELSKELEKKWIRIQKMSADRSIELDAAIEKMTILQDCLEDLNQHLSLVEAESASWLSVPELVKTGDVQREMTAVQAFQQKIAPIQGEVDQCNDAANQLGDVVASHRVVVQLEDATRRWRNLQLATEERLASLQNVSKRHGSFSQHILTASVAYPWERAVTSSNVPYYINHSRQSTHWDHPEMTRLVESLSGFDEVRFSAYRTAMKLRHLQKSLHLDCISLEDLPVCFDSVPGTKYVKNLPLLSSSSSSPSSRLKQERIEESILTSKVGSGSSFDGTPTSSLDRTKSFRRGERLVGVVDVAACLRFCFESLHFSPSSAPPRGETEGKPQSGKKPGEVRNVSDVNVPLSMDLVLNWLLNVYDSSRNGVMRLSSFKTALVLMCNGSLEDKYKYLFQLMSGEEGSVDRSRLTRLLKDCIFVPRQLGEATSFGGTNVEPSVTSCFEKSGDKGNISEKDFLNWMKMEPQSLVWIPVLHRLRNSEEARHHVRCQCCKQLPLRGLRYRCHKCFSYDLCQNCFFAGKTTKNHKLSHPMQEYSSETTSSENVRDFTKVFKNKFRSKRYFQKHRRIGYLPVKISLESGEEEEEDDDEELSPQSTTDDSTLLQRGLSSSGKSHPDVFGSNPEGFSDEHNLIAQYCQSLKGSKAEVEPSSPLQILKKLDAERREEVEEMIRDLENENKNLKAEYERLLRGKNLPTGRTRNGARGERRESSPRVDDADARRSIEEKLAVLGENNQHLQDELSQLQGTNVGECRSISTSGPSLNFGDSVKAHKDNGIRELELDRMLQKLQSDDLPVNPGEANVSSLFREVEQINRAVETLVDIMTEGEEPKH